MKTKQESITEYLNSLSDDELLWIYDEYCNETYEEKIYNNDEHFFEMYFERDIDSALRAVCYGDYRYTDEYVVFNGYGNLDSFNACSLLDHIPIDEIADWCIENANSLENETIESILTNKK